MVESRFPCLPLPPEKWDEIAAALALSPQQKRIVGLMLRDMSGKQIAAEMGLGMPTLRTYIRRIYDKIGVESEKSLILLIFGMSHGLRHPPP